LEQKTELNKYWMKSTLVAEGIRPQKHGRNQILITCSDMKSSTLLARALKEVGFLVEAVRSRQEALELLEIRPVALILIELPLSNIDDSEFMQDIHNLRPETLIVVRHNQPTIKSAMAAIKVGAADYLIGPPDAHEDFQAVVRALHKHAEQMERLVDEFVRGARSYLNGVDKPSRSTREFSMAAQTAVVVGDLSLYLPIRTLSSVSKPDRNVHLTTGESQILLTLMSQPRKGMSCRAILREARGQDMLDIEAKSVVRPYITRIRRKLREAQINPYTIRTVRGLGYIFDPVSGTQNLVNNRSS
jgi:DNA-binding response OmpR family regulator